MLGAAVASFAYYTTSGTQRQQKAKGFTIFSTLSFTPAGSSEARITGNRVRYQKSDGSFKQTTTYLNPDGTVKKTDVLFAQLGRGVFEVSGNEKVLSFLSPMRAQKPPMSEAELRGDHNHNIVKEELVLGYRTLVARILDNGDSSSYTELYHALELQGFQIKTVNVSQAGTTVIEPTKIQVGEPAESDFGMPNLPISYDRFEMKINAMEDSGQHETAEKLRQQLREAKQQ
jgi:hypothetical protein